MTAARYRNLVVAYLALLRVVATGPGRPTDTLVEQLGVLRRDGLRQTGAEDECAGLANLPGWLAGDSDSGLSLVLDAATDRAKQSSVPAEVARLLGDGLVVDLMSLSSALSDEPAPGPADPGEAPAVVLVADDGRFVVTTLWSTTDPISEHPWFRPVDALTDVSADATAAVRRALGTFESLDRIEVPTSLDSGYVWPEQVPGRAVLTVHCALAALARITGLASPFPALIAAGDSEDDHTFKPMPAEEVAALHAAAAHLRCDTLVPTNEGWRLTRADDTVLVDAEPLRDLDAAARLVWGEDWAEWKRTQHRNELIGMGWTPVDWREIPPNQPVPDTDVPQVDSLFAIFHVGRKIAVLGGTPSSGKSVIVRRLAARLDERRHPPITRLISSRTHELPDRETALRTGRHALGMDKATVGQRRLLVLEDLHPVGDGDVDDLLPYLSRSLNASILAVLQYDTNSNEDWQTDHLNVVTAIVGRQALRDLVQRLGDRHPDLLSGSVGLAALDRLQPRPDVPRLIQIMLRSPADSGGEVDVAAADAALIERFRALDEAAREAVARTAAWSLCRGGTGSATLDAVAPDDVAAFGMRPDAAGERWSIASPDRCRAIVAAYGEAGSTVANATEQAVASSQQPMDSTMADLLLLDLLSSLRAGSERAVTDLRGIRLYRNALCAEVVRRAWEEGPLQQWTQQVHPARVAELLIALNVWLSNAVVRHALDRLVTRLGERLDRYEVGEVLTILRCLRHYLAEISPQWQSTSNWVRSQIDMILTEGSGSPDERFQLLRRAESFHDPMLKELVAERAVDALPGLDASRADDYYLVRRVRTLQSRAERALRRDRLPIPVDQEEAVHGLLSGEPQPNAGFHVVLGWLILCRYFREDAWVDLLDAHEYRFTPSMRYTSPQEFARAVDELRNYGSAYANFLFNRAVRYNPRRKVQESQPFFEAVRKMLREASPMEAMEMIRTVAAAYGRAAYELLYPQRDVPDDDLARSMADKVELQADTKGAGMLLSVTRAVDELYAVQTTGFARRFAEHLGEERTVRMLREDPRPSVKYYLLKGLWEAQVPFRGACLEATLDVVMDAMATGRNAWGPRLALQVGADPEMGQEFLVELRRRKSMESLVRSMGSYSSPEVQTEFHRLARALHPAASTVYTEQFDINAFLQPLAAAAPVSAIECCREVGRTLADGDYRDGGRDIVVAADSAMDERNAWANRLARSRTGEAFAQVLNILLDVDRPTARSAVAAYGVRDDASADGEWESLLVGKVRHAMLDSAPGASSLLHSLDEAEPGLGRAVYDRLRGDDVVRTVFNIELQLLQAPSTQYAVAAHLAAIGILPGHADTDWMSAVRAVQVQFVRHLGSPRALGDILRMLSIWNETWADQAVKAVNYAKVLARLSVGLAHDLAPAVRLAALLFDLDDRAGSARIVESLGELPSAAVLRYVGLRDACTLLHLTRYLTPERTAALGAGINALLASYLTRPVVLDEPEQWLEVGYAGHSLGEAGLRLTTSAVPNTAPNIAHSGPVVWGLQHLPDTEWRRRPLIAASERLFADQYRDNTSLFCAMAAASRSGRLGEVSPLITDHSRLAQMSFRQLRVLHELAEVDGGLAGLLGDATDAIRERLAAPVARVSWNARRLTESLDRLARQQSGGPEFTARDQ